MSEHHDHGGHGGHDTTGVHGMLLFGDETLYLSHLPMFESPHNFQVLLEVTFDDAVLKALRDDGTDGILTFVPEPFPIVELDPRGDGPARTTIAGTIFRGHFERGGEPLAEGVAAQVRDVVVFRELDVGAKRAGDERLTYLCLGRPDQLHLVHEVTARPDFDHVLTARLVPGTATNLAGRPADEEVTTEFRGDPVEFGDRSDTPENRLAPRERAAAIFLKTIGPGGSHGFAAELEAGEDVYVEVDELR